MECQLIGWGHHAAHLFIPRCNLKSPNHLLACFLGGHPYGHGDKLRNSTLTEIRAQDQAQGLGSCEQWRYLLHHQAALELSAKFYTPLPMVSRWKKEKCIAILQFFFNNSLSSFYPEGMQISALKHSVCFPKHQAREKCSVCWVCKTIDLPFWMLYRFSFSTVSRPAVYLHCSCQLLSTSLITELFLNAGLL